MTAVDAMIPFIRFLKFLSNEVKSSIFPVTCCARIKAIKQTKSPSRILVKGAFKIRCFLVFVSISFKISGLK